MLQSNKVLGLVSMLEPVELMKALVKHKGLIPKDAAKVVLNLKRKSEGMTSPGIESNKNFPVPSSMKAGPEDEDEDIGEGGLARGNAKTVWGQGGGPDMIRRHHFPPDPRPDYDEPGGQFPYEQPFMNKLKHRGPKRGLTSGVEKVGNRVVNTGETDPDEPLSVPIKPGGTRAGNVKHKPPTRVDLRQGQPGGDGAGGAGIYQKSTHSRQNSTPSQGTSYTRQGQPGWSASPKGKEFDRPPQSIRKKDRRHVELSQPVGGSQAHRPDNAGDNDFDTPSFMKEPNVGATIWAPGRQKSRSAPYRTYRKK